MDELKVTPPDLSDEGDAAPAEPSPEPRPRLELTPHFADGEPRVAIQALDGFSYFSVEQVLSTALRDWRLAQRLPT